MDGSMLAHARVQNAAVSHCHFVHAAHNCHGWSSLSVESHFDVQPAASEHTSYLCPTKGTNDVRHSFSVHILRLCNTLPIRNRNPFKWQAWTMKREKVATPMRTPHLYLDKWETFPPFRLCMPNNVNLYAYLYLFKKFQITIRRLIQFNVITQPICQWW